MTLREASRLLWEALVPAGWRASVGMREGPGTEPSLVVYVHARRDLKGIRTLVGDSWEGFPVTVRYVGPIRLL